MSKLGVTDLIFVDPGIKVNREYYREVFLSQELLPAIREMSTPSHAQKYAADIYELINLGQIYVKNAPIRCFRDLCAWETLTDQSSLALFIWKGRARSDTSCSPVAACGAPPSGREISDNGFAQ